MTWHIRSMTWMRFSRASAEDLMRLDGVGPNTAEAIVDWFARPANQQVIQKLHEFGVWPTSSRPGLLTAPARARWMG